MTKLELIETIVAVGALIALMAFGLATLLHACLEAYYRIIQ